MSAHEDLDRLLPAPGDPELPRDRHVLLREHLMREITDQNPPATAVGVRRPVRRLLITAGSLSAVAALVTALAVNGHPATSTPSAVPPAARTASPAAGDTTPTTATALLDRVAEVADAQPAVTVRSGQFIYIDSKVAFSSFDEGSGGAPTLAPVHQRQIWLSADSSKPGELVENGRTTPIDPLGNGQTDLSSYAYVSRLPTDPQALLKLIQAQTKGSGTGPDAEAFTRIGDLLREQLLPPQLSAALYRAAELIPGVVLVPDSVDAAGRHGIAVARVDTGNGERSEWIFDSRTYAYLGERDVQATQPSGSDVKPGTVLGISAVLSRSVVDQVGQTG